MFSEIKDVYENAKQLLTLHPTPWSFKTNSLEGYVVDAIGKQIFGGENHEGRVDERDDGIVALVDTINSLAVLMKGEK